MSVLSLHRWQFLLSTDQHPPEKDFRTLPVGGRNLHHSPALPVQQLTDALGEPWLLLGHALESFDTLEPSAQVARTPTAGVQKLTASWAGRWVLIGDNRLATDAGGLFGVYFDTARVSSSPALLYRDQMPEVALDQADRVNWFPPPHSGFPNVSHLLASQVLLLTSMTPEHRSLLLPLPELSYEDVLDRLQGLLLRTMAQAWGQRNLLALTAGNDSRLLLATASHLGMPVLTYTQEHPSSISRADVSLPPLLAKLAGYDHIFVHRPRRRDHARATLYDRQSAGHVREQDREFIAHGQFDFLRPGDLLLRGVVFELGRAFYYNMLPSQASLQALTQRFPSDPYRRGGLSAWFDWALAHPEDLDWRDRLYWEQRIGGWTAASDLALDLLPTERLVPSNSQLFMSLLLRVPVEKRRTAQHHIDLIQRMKPELLSLPINPEESRYSPRRIYGAAYRRLPLQVKKLLYP